MDTRLGNNRKGATKYKVLVAVECIKEYNVVAHDKEQASMLAEARAIKRNKQLTKQGYVVGDVETALVLGWKEQKK